MSSGAQGTSVTMLSVPALLRMLREDGVVDLEDLVERARAVVEEAGGKEDEAPIVDILVHAHFALVYHEPSAPPTTHPPH